jgi:hypothetical protein
MRKREIGQDEARVLGVLHDIAVAGKGWKRGRVRGLGAGGRDQRTTGPGATPPHIWKILLERGIAEHRITEMLIGFWIVQDAKEQEEARSLGCRRHNSLFFGSGA